MSGVVPVTFVLSDLGGGGAQRAMLALARGLDTTRFSIHLIVVGCSEEFARDVPAHATVERLGAARLRNGLPAVLRSLRKRRPKICIVTMGYMNLAMLALGPWLGRELEFVVREANVVDATLRALPRWLPRRRLYAWLYPRAAAVIVQTDAIAGQVRRVAPKVADRIVVLPNPVDQAAHRARAAAPRCMDGQGPMLVAAGRLTQQKGFDRLIAVFPQLPAETRLAIYGEGPERQALEAQVSALGLRDRIALPGFVDDLAARIAGADLFVLPSRWEGMPNVALEALALGVPVVASDDAGVEEIARAAPDAVTIAPVESFPAAIARRRPASAPVASPRPSLLPAEYLMENVATRFSDLLARIARRSA